MALFNEADVKEAARQATQRLRKSAPAILNETRGTAQTSFDVFLSHSRVDSEIILGAKMILEAA